MITVTVLILVDLILRLANGDSSSTPAGLMVLTVVATALVVTGATYGGSKEPRGTAAGGSGGAAAGSAERSVQ